MKLIDTGILDPGSIVSLGIFDDVGVMGPIIYGVVMIGFFLLMLAFIIFTVVSRRKWAKKQAELMLKNEQINPKTIEKTLKILGGRTKDMEAQSMFRKLYQMVGKA